MIVNGKIVDTRLGYGHNDIFTCSLNIEGDSWGCNYGNYALDTPDKTKENLERIGTTPGLTAIMELLKTLEVEDWEQLKGKFVRVEFSKDNDIIRIGHLIKDKWFSFKNFFENYKKMYPNA